MRLIVASLIRGAAPQNPRSPVRRHEGIFTQLKRQGSVNFSEARKFTVRAANNGQMDLFRPQWTLGREGSGHRPPQGADPVACAQGFYGTETTDKLKTCRHGGERATRDARGAARIPLLALRAWMGRSTPPLRTKRSGRDQRGEVLASSRFTPKRRKKPIKINGVQKCRLGDLNPDGATVRCIVDEHAFACLVCCRYHIS